MVCDCGNGSDTNNRSCPDATALSTLSDPVERAGGKAVGSLFDGAVALAVGLGFLLTLVGVGEVYGKLHAYDLGVGALTLFTAVGWLLAPRSMPIGWTEIWIVGAILAFAGGMALLASTLVPSHPQPLIQLLFLARIVGLFVVFAGFSFLAGHFPRMTRLAFLTTGLLLLAYVARAIVTGDFSGYYSYLDIPGTDAPLQSGFTFGVLATLFLGFSIIAASATRRLLSLLLAFCLALSAIGTISRTNTLAIVITFVCAPVVWAIFLGKYRQTLLLFTGIAILVGSFALIYLAGLLPEPVHDPVEATLRRLGKFEAASSLRVRTWTRYFNDAPVHMFAYWLTGLGVGAQSVLSDLDAGFTLRFDSLYLRLFFEWGMLGTSLWLVFFINILARIRRLSRPHMVPFLLLCIYGGVVGVTHEWLFVGVAGYLFMAIIGALLGWALVMSRPEVQRDDPVRASERAVAN